MIHTELAALRPAGATVADIESALARIATERAAIAARVEAANRDRTRLATEGGTAKQRAAIEATIADAAFDREQIDLLEVEAKAALGPAREAEAETAAERAVIAAIEAEERWAAWLATKYPSLAAQIAAGIALEKSAIEAYDRALKLSPGSRSRLPSRAVGYWGTRPMNVSGIARLPGTEKGGAPFVWGTAELIY